MQDHKQKIGFAIGTGIPPAVLTTLILGFVVDEWTLGIIIGVVVFVVVAVSFWTRQRG